MNQLSQLFYNPREGLVSLSKLRQKTRHLNIPYKDVQTFYNNQSVNQVMKRMTKPQRFSSIHAQYAFQYIQMDLLIYNRYKYNGYQYILVVVDVYSRYAYARPLTNRRIETIFDAFQSILKDMKHTPEHVYCDNEFNTVLFNDYFDSHDIAVTYSDPDEPHKNAIVERLNGTIASMLQKVRLVSKRYDWYDYLSDVMYNYNHTVHSTLKQTPHDMLHNNAVSKQRLVHIAMPFSVNDKVRIVRKKQVFDKGDVLKLSEDIYTVESIVGNRVKLHGIKKLYKPYELQAVYEAYAPVQEPITQIREQKITNQRKRESIDASNVITAPRQRRLPARFRD